MKLTNLINNLIHPTRDYPTFSNAAPHGTHAGGALTLKAAAPVGSKYLFASISVDGKEAAVATLGKSTSPRAIGVLTDEAEQAGDYVCLQAFGANTSTLVVQSGGDIDAGQLLTSNTEGKAVPLDGLEAGAYYVYGIALRPSTDGQLVEFAPCVGVERKLG